MKKTITTTIAALFLSTSLVGPAAANDDLIRLGIGLGATLLGEAMKGGGNNRQAQPRKGDKLEGRVDGKPTRQASQQTAMTKKQREEAEKAEWAARFPVPSVGPTPEAKPTPEQMTAWLAAAPEREAQEAAAEAEMAQAPVIATDDTTTAAVEVPQTRSQAQPAEEATVEILDAGGQSWGFVTTSQAAKARKLMELGVNQVEAYRAIGLKGPVEPEEPETFDLIDENGKLWGSAPKEVADNVWKAVDLGMKPSEAIRAIAKLPDPAIAEAEAEAADKTRAECIERAKNGDLLHAGIRHLKCGPYQAEIAEIEAQMEVEEKAEEMANGDKQLAGCIEKRIDPRTKDQRSKECEPFEAEVAHAVAKDEKRKRMSPTQAFNAFNDTARAAKEQQWLDVAKEKREAAVRMAKEKEELDAILGGAPLAEKEPASSAENAENQTAAAPIIEEETSAIDEGSKTAAIEAEPKAEVPVGKAPEKVKPKKLDL
ncbi:hypothetical protein CN198_14155 [Sinorhizobium meliloti]|uniref:hypothetical protein n=1 Tax=Rhizobium meliloti TaxID=382 RepID=UPI000FDB9477|nr:hypothetical protein [Sinorhizobium meliloti]RVH69201.1 hypothetical protein CN198_14155 [Sinorhizobium meliloti]